MATLTVQERNWAALSHASGAILMFLMASFGFVGPLLIYLMKHEESPAIRYHAKQALYFQLAMTFIVWVCGALGTALSCFLVGFVLYIPAFVAWVAGIVVPLIAATRVNNGEDGYAYPLTGGMVERPLQLR